jgi:hypothetical protein
MRPSRYLTAAAFLLTLCATHAQAQSPGTPEAFALQYFNAVRKSDWAGASALMHPDALAQMKSLFRPVVAGDRQMQVATTLFGVKDVMEFDKATGAQLFARLMQNTLQASPEVKPLLANSSAEMLGHVNEDKAALVHVVYRLTVSMEGATLAKVETLPVKRLGTQWRAMLSSDVEGLAAALTARMKQQHS